MFEVLDHEFSQERASALSAKPNRCPSLDWLLNRYSQLKTIRNSEGKLFNILKHAIEDKERAV